MSEYTAYRENLYINGQLAILNGVRMGDGFIETLRQPFELKEFITNESRLEHGSRITVVNPKVASRGISLTFNIHGDSREDYNSNLAWLYGHLNKGEVTLKSNDITVYNIKTEKMIHPVFHLLYTGKSINYGETCDGMNGKLTAQFMEPDPSNRTEQEENASE